MDTKIAIHLTNVSTLPTKNIDIRQTISSIIEKITIKTILENMGVDLTKYINYTPEEKKKVKKAIIDILDSNNNNNPKYLEKLIKIERKFENIKPPIKKSVLKKL